MSTPEPDVSGLSLGFVEGLYEDYLSDPSSVPEDWAGYFEAQNGKATSARLGPRFERSGVFNPAGGEQARDGRGNGHAAAADVAELQHRVDNLIRNYRARGHMMADLDPLHPRTRRQPELEPEHHGLRKEHLGLRFSTINFSSANSLTLREIIERLENTYCRTIGVQILHIDDIEMRDWLQTRMESSQNRLALSGDAQKRIFARLTDAVMFEEFIQRKYPGAKSFSLEGAESLIPLLTLAIEQAGEYEVEDIVIAMAHRGRLNVLANIMGKDPTKIFREYEDKDPESYMGQGDVKYHLGYHSDYKTEGGHTLHLALCFNPSHLEFVNPVALGRVRAWQDRMDDEERTRGMAILIHGDAAFAGEGIVQETLNLSNLEGFTTGGTLHVIVNNQLGFTTNPRDGRSSIYCTDVARMLQAPIFHVNGEDPEAVAQVVTVAMEFRKKFKHDAVIDMYCYRKRGHNEGDEPSFTQPLMYKAIAARKSVRDSYRDRLAEMGGLKEGEADAIETARRDKLEAALTEARTTSQVRPASVLRGIWSNYRGGPDTEVPDVDTGVEGKLLGAYIERLTTYPAGFAVHEKLERILATRRKMAGGEEPIDWAMAEALALASLADEGARIRMSGQDCQRGTFSHRHAMLVDQKTGSAYMPLQHISPRQAPVGIWNSPLSEAGVVGFEYGYSVATPDGLILWEAQFGDFVNAAQVIIDQFISSAEDKWRSLSGLVLLLPHGFEGMGPEHSSARVERFFSIAAEDNIQVCWPSTPAQYFHLLRRQVKRPWRKPLIVMTPKSLLRNPKSVSSLDELAQGRFQRILADTRANAANTRRILMCAGKIYYELDAERRDQGIEDVAILRVEQLYPLQPPDLEKALGGYAADTPVVWVQEEPENMGAWRRMKGKFGDRVLGRFPFSVVCRAASASPATGSAHSHRIEQRQIITTAFE